MIDKDYFVMLTHPNCPPIPMTDCDGNVSWFESKEQASVFALGTVLGQAYGYEVFRLGCGE